MVQYDPVLVHDAGVMGPVSMTDSAIPALRRNPELAPEWEPRLTLPDYDRGALCGMAGTFVTPPAHPFRSCSMSTARQP